MIFALLLAGHLIGDWVVQSDAQARFKTTRWGANLGHVLTYHLTIFAFLLVGGVWSWSLFWGLVFVSVPTHAVIDRRWPVEWLLRHTGSVDFAKTPLGILTADQALHIAILALIASWAVS